MNLNAWGKWERCFTESAKPVPRKPLNKYFCFLGSEWEGEFHTWGYKIKCKLIWKNKGSFENSLPFGITVFPSVVFTIFLCFTPSDLETSLARCLSVTSVPWELVQCWWGIFIHSGVVAMESWQWGAILTLLLVLVLLNLWDDLTYTSTSLLVYYRVFTSKR